LRCQFEFGGTLADETRPDSTNTSKLTCKNLTSIALIFRDLRACEQALSDKHLENRHNWEDDGIVIHGGISEHSVVMGRIFDSKRGAIISAKTFTIPTEVNASLRATDVNDIDSLTFYLVNNSTDIFSVC
jgi:hypothetical protein